MPDRIQIVEEHDVAVAGGSVRAVAAAVEAARCGCRVFLAAPRSYLGEDLCGTLRMWPRDEAADSGEITSAIFAEGIPARPMHVKKVLEKFLLEAGVSFMLCSCPTGVLRSADGKVSGLVIAGRSGHHGIAAGAVIDATEFAVVARDAGADFVPLDGATTGNSLHRRIVVARNAKGAERRMQLATDPELSYFEHTVDLDAASTDPVSVARQEQIARDRTYRKGQIRAAEKLHRVPADKVLCRGDGPRADELSAVKTGCLEPVGTENLYVLGPRAEVEHGVRLMEPGMGEAWGRAAGTRVGEAVSGNRRPPAKVAVSAVTGPSIAGGVRTDHGAGFRSVKTSRDQCQEVEDRRMFPLLASCDVVVVGGGTSGACAAIGAARGGAQVLVLEYQEGPGGTGTVGMIGRPYHGRQAGFADEVPFPGDDYTTEDKMEWFRRQIAAEEGEIWTRALVCGAWVQEDRVRGVHVVTPAGGGLVEADTVVDSTGNADVAVAAGADHFYGDEPRDIAVQGAGLPVRPLESSYVNTDYLLVEESDMVDTARAFTGARLAIEDDAYDVGPMLQVRERRRVVGEHVLSYLDQIAERTYPDSVVYSGSDYDSHGYPSLPYFALLPHDDQSRNQNHPAPGGTCYTPYRCLLPRGLEGILVTGTGISMHRDATAMVRMQHDLHNQGYAAGAAAAMALRNDKKLTEINVRELQRHLVEIGSLPEEVLDHTDAFPMSAQDIEDAVDDYGNAANPSEAGRPLAIILSHPEVAYPRLKEAFDGADEPAKTNYAKVLGVFGESELTPCLAEKLRAVDVWDEKIMQGRMAEYAHLPTPTDGLILALGYSGGEGALEAVLEKLRMLDAGVTLSHHRAVALALEALENKAAAEPLARLLEKPGMSGHAMTELVPLPNTPPSERRREPALREIVLARALFRCGDCEELGERVLREYLRDLRGLFRRHAATVLRCPGKAPSDE
ncbi:MAG: FAD-dependent oxidoreductase [Candidatus Brocadiia bacterium]